VLTLSLFLVSQRSSSSSPTALLSQVGSAI
jgi:hypothetical protein